MFDTARELYERIRHQWQVNAPSQDEFTLYIYETIEDEYESGDVHKGLMAKSNVECDYDVSKAKALYIRTRVNQLLKHREVIAQTIADIKTEADRIAELHTKLGEEKTELLNLNKSPDEHDLQVARGAIRVEAEQEKKTREDDIGNTGDISLLLLMGVLGFSPAIANYYENDGALTLGSSLFLIAGCACFGAIPVFKRRKRIKAEELNEKIDKIKRQSNDPQLVHKRAQEIIDKKRAELEERIKLLNLQLQELEPRLKRKEQELATIFS